jgi:hypothetical protein
MSNRILAIFAIAALVGSVLVTQGALPGPDQAAADIGAVNLLFTAPGTPARYGANQVVALEAGNINFVADCKSNRTGPGDRDHPGIPDKFQPFANLYIVPAGSTFTNNAALTDAAATEPNRVHGGTAGSFLYEPLGATKPLGKIKGGTWGIVVDECQNGVFDTGEDTFVDNAFRVDLDQFVPSIGPENASFLAMKERAGKGATALEDLETLLQLHTLFEQARAAYSLAQAVQ